MVKLVGGLVPVPRQQRARYQREHGSRHRLPESKNLKATVPAKQRRRREGNIQKQEEGGQLGQTNRAHSSQITKYLLVNYISSFNNKTNEIIIK
ncbi:hypothetical protein BpHYR1_015503 [Brachionus plicatilis]|uniref:Uncharacterized protein n=1 Tax=Brachionus plicatilis TaxID=10195 RepID=A0A3M7SKL5_BRAPC|nr:hypothetical protein BpHYR1_015503 [Brachionus plicatilis]